MVVPSFSFILQRALVVELSVALVVVLEIERVAGVDVKPVQCSADKHLLLAELRVAVVCLCAWRKSAPGAGAVLPNKRSITYTGWSSAS